MKTKLLAIDQGTTSSRSILFDETLNVVAVSQKEIRQYYPQPGWVEHDAEEIWQTTLQTARDVLAQTSTKPSDIAALGITNQRETTVIWERATGKPIHKAIVWQDRRTADICANLKDAGKEAAVTAKTGLLLDPYFSATKIAWLLDHVPGARARAERGELAFGTIDSFLLWNLTQGRLHVTDATNASRTLLYDLETSGFAEELLELFRVPAALLPEIRDSAGDFGSTDAALFGAPIRIGGIAGDQQAATVGQACFKPGMMKSTYGTGAFMLLNTGEERVVSANKLLTTVAYQIGGKRAYALEGSVFVAGNAVKWLRDGLKIVHTVAETAAMAETSDPAQQIYFVPALVGLGAPYWNPNARGAISGITAATSPKEFARATLESMAYQTHDLLQAMRADWPHAQDAQTILRVDGGMVANDWMLQFVADILNTSIERPRVLETTAVGAAYLAGLSAGVCPPPEVFATQWQGERKFEPKMDAALRAKKLDGWKDAVRRVL